MRFLAKAFAIALCLAAPAVGQDLSLPQGAELGFEFNRNPGVYDLPTGGFDRDQGIVPVRRIEGAVQLQSWRIEARGLTPFQLLSPLRDQLVSAGYRVTLDCIAQACGGFDFRFNTTVLPAPEMFVDLTDFHFLSAENEDGDAVSILTSRDGETGYVQIVRAGRTGTTQTSAPAVQSAQTTSRAPVGTGTFTEALEDMGFVVLSDLIFETGSSELGAGRIPSLDEIAGYLQANPTRQVLFVGHTDSVGSLAGNQRLSRRRAEAAMRYLIDWHGLPKAQLGADGVGFLSPVASNLTTEGRDANRRVEAILTSTE